MIGAIICFALAGAFLTLAFVFMARKPAPRPPLVCRRSKLHRQLMGRVIQAQRSADDFNWVREPHWPNERNN